MSRSLIVLTALVASVLLAGCGQRVGPADDPTAEPAPQEPGQPGDGAAEPTAPPDAAEEPAAPVVEAEQRPGECGLPPFELRGLPWEADPSEPDEIQARDEVTALVWYGSEGRRSLQLLVGQPLRAGVEPTDTVEVRGHEAKIWWTGQAGSGVVSAYWQEGTDPCAQYMVLLGPADDANELLDVLPD